MGYTQNNPLPRMKSALKMRKAEKKSGLHRNSALHNAEQYGIQGNDELDYMPIMDHGAATPMHRESAQGYNARLDESLAKDGKESSMKQSLKDRRDESKGMKKSRGKGAYSSDPKMS